LAFTLKQAFTHAFLSRALFAQKFETHFLLIPQFRGSSTELGQLCAAAEGRAGAAKQGPTGELQYHTAAQYNK